MATTTRRISADEWEASPFCDEDKIRELIDGRFVMDPPLPVHAVIAMAISYALYDYCRAHGGLAGERIGVRVGEWDIYEPDVWWYSADRAPTDLDQHVRTVPNLVVEIRSPSSWHYDTGRKRRMYEAAGVPELWLVDTKAESVLVSRRSAPSATEFDVTLEVTEILTSPMLPGFRLKLADVFPD